MRRKILIYTNCLDGHHLEYIHHIYVRAASETKHTFIFVVPDRFLSMKKLMDWPDATNVTFDYLSEKETKRCNRNKYLHFLGTQTYSAYILSRKIRKHQPDCVLMDIDKGIPYVELFLPRSLKTRISCICFRIIPYQWDSLPWVKKVIEWITYHVVLKKERYHTVFLLNNRKYIGLHNEKFNTDKYKYLTDPVTVEASVGVDLRKSLGISDHATVFIHLGCMGKEKGTFGILDAIRMLSADELKDKYFIFAGKIGAGIKEEFYKKLNAIASPHVIVYDRFCEYELFCSLYKTCDYVLFPYQPRPNSSGLLGNAALFGKPAITTDGGAMGDLVREYHLGYLMEDNSPRCIYQAILNPKIENYNPEEYVKDHTIKNFCDQIFESFE